MFIDLVLAGSTTEGTGSTMESDCGQFYFSGLLLATLILVMLARISLKNKQKEIISKGTKFSLYLSVCGPGFQIEGDTCTQCQGNTFNPDYDSTCRECPSDRQANAENN